MNDSVLAKNKRHFASLKPKPPFYGAPVGILLFERPGDPFNRPFIPGRVVNACTWSVPVRYKTMPGINFARILAPNAAELASVVAQTATELVREGAQLITSH